MKYLFTPILRLSLILSGCGLSSFSSPSFAAPAATPFLDLAGPEAHAFAEALLASGMQSDPSGPGKSLLYGSSLRCEVSSETAGRALCTVYGSSHSFFTIKDEPASVLLGILGGHGWSVGSAHSGLVTAGLSSFRCLLYAGQTAADSCSLQGL